MQYDTLIMARQEHEERIDRLSQSYTDAQADSKSIQMYLSSGIERISRFFGAFGSRSLQSSSNTYERSPQFAPVILDDRRGDSW